MAEAVCLHRVWARRRFGRQCADCGQREYGQAAAVAADVPAPAAIVVRVAEGWRIALRVVVTKRGVLEPAVAVYEFAPGLPYRTAVAAGVDAELVLHRARHQPVRFLDEHHEE